MFTSKWVVASQHTLGDEVHMDTTLSLCFSMVRNYLFYVLTSRSLLHSSVGMEGDSLSMYFDWKWKESLELSLWIGPRRQEVEMRPGSRMGGISAGARAAQCIPKWSVKRWKNKVTSSELFCGHKGEGHLWKLQKAFEIMRVPKI